MSIAGDVHAKFFPRTRPIVTAPHVQPIRADVALMLVQAEQRGFDRGLAEGRRIAAIQAAIDHDAAAEVAQQATMIEIAEQVAVRHGLASWRDLRARRRDRITTIPRQEAMWRCHHETSQSLPAIGRFFGGFDHTTVLHAVRAHQKRMGGDDVRDAKHR